MTCASPLGGRRLAGDPHPVARAYRNARGHVGGHDNGRPGVHGQVPRLARLVIAGRAMASAGEETCELAARGDAELGENLPQVVGDGGAADEQLRGDLGVRPADGGHACD